jgi:hypothetical protein
MAEGFSDYKFPGVSQTPQIAIPPTIGEEKAEAGPQLSFAERVKALDEHDRKKIDRYLSGKDLKILSSSKQRKILWKAIFYKDVDAVKVLLECGVDVNRYDSEGVTLSFRLANSLIPVLSKLFCSRARIQISLRRTDSSWRPYT